MANDNYSIRRNRPRFGIWGALLLLVLVGIVVAVVVKAMSIWAAVASFVLVAIGIGLLANAPDITRYMKISSM